MRSVIYKRVSNLEELKQIQVLQLENSVLNLALEEKLQEGFVTAQHSVELLKKMNTACAHIIAKDNEKVIGFALVMLPSFRNELEVLIPMFDRIDALIPVDKSFVVMGQICIAKTHRKQGIFRQLYHFYRAELQSEFDYLITEVDSINLRSMQAHEVIGFKTIESYVEAGVTWNIILWDWK